MRSAEVVRKTAETKVELQLNIDGKGNSSIDTGVGFFNHMLTLMTKHGFMDLAVKCDGDSDVDDHHSVEDVGIVLGQAFLQALGDKAGIRRYASVFTPMDESLSQVSIDISGRPFLYFDVEIPTEKVGTFDTELVEEFFRAFVNQSGLHSISNCCTGKTATISLNPFLKDLAGCWMKRPPLTKELKVFGRQKECCSVSGTITNDTTERCADIKDGSFECQESI